MPTTQFDYAASTDGPKLQVQDFIKQPKMVQSLIVRMLNQKFIADSLLRPGGTTPSGVYKYTEEEPLYADGFEVIEEYGEIPVTQAQAGVGRAVFTVKAGGAMMISREMRQRNDIDAVNRRMRQIKNGFVRFWDRRLWAAMDHGLPTMAVSGGAWTDPASKIRYDVAKASEAIQGATSENGDEVDYQPDTLVIHPTRASAWIYNDDIARVYLNSPLATRNPQYTGDQLKDLLGLQVWTTPHIAQDKALVCERKTIGFIGDENPLEVTPLYELREKQTHRSDTTRRSAIGIDQPKAGIFLTGV